MLFAKKGVSVDENKSRGAKKMAKTRRNESLFALLKKAPKKIKIILAVMLVIILALVAVKMLQVFMPPSEPIVETKVTELGFKDIGELVTQAAFYTEIVHESNYRKLFNTDINIFGTKSSIIASLDGVIKAGLDFAAIVYAIDDEKQEVSIKLPEAKVLSNEVDHDSLQVYDEKQNLFNPQSFIIINETYKRVEEAAEKKAIDNGLLLDAIENAKKLIVGMCKQVLPGYKVVFS